MFILENPYVSKFMIKTLEENQFEVLNNSVAQSFANDYKLNLVDKISCEKIYSNSENSIDFVLDECKNFQISTLINISKNKVDFRKGLMELYPKFFFKEILYNDLRKVDISNFPEQFIIKPSVGFLSMGVHKVSSHSEWQDVVETIEAETKDFIKHFPNTVLSSSSFIVEEIIQGDEYAVDAYYNEDGEPVILNIFQHPFVSVDDVSDRVYISSKEIIEANLEQFKNMLKSIGKALSMKNFPIHIELIRTKENIVIPVEINPMRFAGWCTTDLANFAYGINIYEYFQNGLEPDWKDILNGKENKIFYFAMAETPQNIDKNNIEFNYNIFKQCFSKILDFREIDYRKKPLFAIIFGEAENMDEIDKILKLNMNDFIN